MAREHTDHDIDDDIVCRVNGLLDLLGPRCSHVRDVEDIDAEHFVLLYHHVTDQIVPGSASIKSKRDGAKIVQYIVDSLAEDIFGIPMDHMTGTGLVAGNRRMIADLLEIFSSIMLPDQTVVETGGNLDETNSLDDLSTPMREVLRSLQDDVEFLARTAMLQNVKRDVIHKVRDEYTQTTPTSMKSSLTSPILWKEVLRKTSRQSRFGDNRHFQTQPNLISRNTNQYLTQSYRLGKKASTPKYGNVMSKSTNCLPRRTVQGTSRPPGVRTAAVSRTTSTTNPEVQRRLRRQQEQTRECISLPRPKNLGKEGGTSQPTTTQELIDQISSSLHLSSLLETTRSQHAQQQRTTLATDDNNNLQLTDLCPRKTVRPFVSERRGSKPQIQRPMKKVVKPKPVISSKFRRKSSTGSTSSMHPYYQHETLKSSTKISDQLIKDNVGYKKMMKLTDQVKSIRERQLEISKQITQLQQENRSLKQLENLIIKEIRLTKSIEDRKCRPRGISVL